MAKLISIIISAMVGAALAGVAVAGVVSSTVAAPSHNPASGNIVNYGKR